MAWTADCTVPYPVTTTTTASGLRSPIWCRASSPPAPGNFRSSSTTSMFCVSNVRYACSAESADGTFVVNDQEIEKVRSFKLSRVRGEYACSHGESPLYFQIGTFGTGTLEIRGNRTLRIGASRIEGTVRVNFV